jgi:hypothetical protein
MRPPTGEHWEEFIEEGLIENVALDVQKEMQKSMELLPTGFAQSL